jgi:hypothetical protein
VPRPDLLGQSLKQKMAAGWSMADYASHPFRYESVTVAVTATDNRNADKAVTRLASYLRRQQIPELREEALMHFLGLGPPVGADTEFYIVGRSPENFDDPRERQVLVHLEPARVEPMVHALAGQPTDGSDVILTVGPLLAAGREDTKRLLGFVAQDEWPHLGVAIADAANAFDQREKDRAAASESARKKRLPPPSSPPHAIDVVEPDSDNRTDGEPMRHGIPSTERTGSALIVPFGTPTTAPARPAPSPRQRLSGASPHGTTRDDAREPITVVVRFLAPEAGTTDQTSPAAAPPRAPASRPATTTRDADR